ncbi:hypothetical protein BGZ80_009888 [Entomortierella chlamydospora]|uniref:Uncharacterized protein n=1 Tax=Entomortierella chlamydospora TaxID=101097 RepID=A0A9P6MWG6_9FUNG|nr:hypothetical protein BGZ80_009888 [Entomortierella chlamydospora]
MYEHGNEVVDVSVDEKTAEPRYETLDAEVEEVHIVVDAAVAKAVAVTDYSEVAHVVHEVRDDREEEVHGEAVHEIYVAHAKVDGETGMGALCEKVLFGVAD